MELIYPWVLYIGIPLCIILFFARVKKVNKYKDGKKIANSHYAKSLPYYKSLMKKYKIIIFSIELLCLICIFVSLFMISRPAEVKRNEEEIYNRDIFLCLDVSGSMYKLNAEVCDFLRDTVGELKGERFGITLFNNTSVLAVPLTDDYNFVDSALESLKKGFETEYTDGSDLYEYSYLSGYVTEGTYSIDIGGASLIGDGLASSAINFPNLEEERTRIIIFCTDNYLAGEPLLQLDEAAKLCKDKGIKVYGISPENVDDKTYTEFDNAMKITGGKTYKMTSSYTIPRIVSEIEETEESAYKTKSNARVVDKPVIPFIILIIGLAVLFIIEKIFLRNIG